MTFRTPDEAVALANNTRYGLAASLWTENVNRALEVAAQLKAGVVWINSTNMFDAAAGFGGYRESGYGREGGREGSSNISSPTRCRAFDAEGRRRRSSAPRRARRRRLEHRPYGENVYRRQAGAPRRRRFLQRAR